MPLTSDSKFTPPGFLPDHFCVILKSGVRVYVKANPLFELHTDSRGHVQVLFEEDGCLKAAFDREEIAGLIYPQQLPSNRLPQEHDAKKVCTRCNVEKPLTEFSRVRVSEDGHNHRCKQCEMERMREYDRLYGRDAGPDAIVEAKP